MDGNTKDKKVAVRNAAEVWPDGKLNLSDGTIKLLNPGMASGGRFRLKLFFKEKYSILSKANPKHTAKSN